MTASELTVLIDQLDELMAEGTDDPEEGLELAALAGMAERLGASTAQLADAVAWKNGPGAALLTEAWALVDCEAYIDAIEGLAGEESTDEQVEEVLLDFDELCAAALWCGKAALVRDAARRVEETVKMMPEVYASAATYGKDLARLAPVAQNLDVYGWWLAVADATALE